MPENNTQQEQSESKVQTYDDSIRLYEAKVKRAARQAILAGVRR